MDSDSDEDLGILKPAWGSGTLPDDFDPNKPPESGEEYLHHVMHEKKQLQSWVTVDIDKSKFKDRQTFKLDLIDDSVETHPEILPSPIWQKEQIFEFEAFRVYLQKYKIPDPSNTVTNSPLWLDRIKTQKPTLSEMNSFSEIGKRNLLNNIITLLEDVDAGSSLPDRVALWLYATFSTLDIPVSPEICYFLRDIARKCRRLRSHLERDASDLVYVPYNLVICLVGRYFNQLDLADPL